MYRVVQQQIFTGGRKKNCKLEDASVDNTLRNKQTEKKKNGKKKNRA